MDSGAVVDGLGGVAAGGVDGLIGGLAGGSAAGGAAPSLATGALARRLGGVTTATHLCLPVTFGTLPKSNMCQLSNR